MADKATLLARQRTASDRLIEAVKSGRANVLSNVIYDAANDGQEFPDGESGVEVEVHGYDCDDLAAVLLPILETARRIAYRGDCDACGAPDELIEVW